MWAPWGDSVNLGVGPHKAGWMAAPADRGGEAVSVGRGGWVGCCRAGPGVPGT